jgi:hypothetical protein
VAHRLLEKGEGPALRFVEARLREALEVARTTRYGEPVYFLEMAYMSVSAIIRELAVAERSSKG